MAEERARPGRGAVRHIAPAYWVKYGRYADATHRLFVRKLLGRLGARRQLLDAACGGGLYDGMLVEAGHRALGIDQSGHAVPRAGAPSAGALPGLRYAKMGLQEMDFESEFDGAICVDAMEHISPKTGRGSWLASTRRSSRAACSTSRSPRPSPTRIRGLRARQGDGAAGGARRGRRRNGRGLRGSRSLDPLDPNATAGTGSTAPSTTTSTPGAGARLARSSGAGDRGEGTGTGTRIPWQGRTRRLVIPQTTDPVGGRL